jgi:ubiquinone/menaquinone biosynthesis C-methylase UbiE
MSSLKILNNRTWVGSFLDFIFFPIRALFIPESSRFGLSSLRDQRMRMVARFCKGYTLDVGCGPGNLFIHHFYRNGKGLDCYQYEDVENIVEDMKKLPFSDETFDSITLIAVASHIPRSQRTEQFQEYARLLKKGGLLIMTEGEMITQTLGHIYRKFTSPIFFGKKSIDEERGMLEDEEYCIPFNEIKKLLNQSPFKLISKKSFMWRLNYVYIAEKT